MSRLKGFVKFSDGKKKVDILFTTEKQARDYIKTLQKWGTVNCKIIKAIC